jgi:hypothetical protein
MAAPAGKWLLGLCESAHRWVQREPPVHPDAQTPAYIDLIFSFGLARLGEDEASRELQERARVRLENRDDTHRFLLAAYSFRIEQALSGRPHAGPLPSLLVEEGEGLDLYHRYQVDRLRQRSKILEPDQHIDPFGRVAYKLGLVPRDCVELPTIQDPEELRRRVEKLLREGLEGSGKKREPFLAHNLALDCATRVEKPVALWILDQVALRYDALAEVAEWGSEVWDRANLLQKALFVAAYFRDQGRVRDFCARSRDFLGRVPDRFFWNAADSLGRQYLQSARKLQLRDEIARFVVLVEDAILGPRDIASISRQETPPEPSELRTLLCLGAGWYSLGREGQADPILNMVRSRLFWPEPPRRKQGQSAESAQGEQTKLACAYVATLGLAPPDVARRRFIDLFEGLQGVRDTYSTKSHFSLSQLEVVEAVVLAAVGEADVPVIVEEESRG